MTKDIKIIANIEVYDYSLDKSLSCLERMGKLFPIVRTGKSSFRIFLINDGVNCLVDVSQLNDFIQISILSGKIDDIIIENIFRKIKDILNLDAEIYNKIEGNSYGLVDSKNLFKSLKGLRIIRDISVFNCVLRAIISQQVSMKVSSNIVRRFIECYGYRTEFDGNYYFQFPSVEFIVNNITVNKLREIGIPLSRATAIMDLVQKIYNTGKELEYFDYNELKDYLISIKGIGKWTIETVGLFYFIYPGVMLESDVGLHRAIEYLYELPIKSISKDNVNDIIFGWTGNRSLLIYYIWEYWMLSR